jgi:hypothetical protein
MVDPNEPVMLTYRCPGGHAGRVRELLEGKHWCGVRYEERQPSWLLRWLDGSSIFSIRCPDFFVEQLHQHLADRKA